MLPAANYNFAGQYQQAPAPLGGGLVKEEWFKRYRENDLPERFDRIVQSWDTANKATELSDFSVCTTYRRLAEADEQRRKPQPTKTVYAKGSMEWFAEQQKSR